MDADLLRDILAFTEEHEELSGWVEVSLPGRTQDAITHHVQLLNEAGLIDAMNQSTQEGIRWVPQRLTYQGHEFLAAARNESVWNKAKANVRATTGTLTVEALKQVLEAIIRGMVG